MKTCGFGIWERSKIDSVRSWGREWGEERERSNSLAVSWDAAWRSIMFPVALVMLPPRKILLNFFHFSPWHIPSCKSRGPKFLSLKKKENNSSNIAKNISPPSKPECSHSQKEKSCKYFQILNRNLKSQEINYCPISLKLWNCFLGEHLWILNMPRWKHSVQYTHIRWECSLNTYEMLSLSSFGLLWMISHSSLQVKWFPCSPGRRESCRGGCRCEQIVSL